MRVRHGGRRRSEAGAWARAGCLVAAASATLGACAAIAQAPEQGAAAAANAAPAVATPYKKDAAALEIYPSAGPVVRFETIARESDEDSDSVVVGELRPFPLLVVEHRRWEGGTTELVNLVSGERTDLRGAPVVSPDGARLFSSGEWLESSYGPNHLTVYRLEAGARLVQEISLEGDAQSGPSWGPVSPAWRGDGEIRFDKKAYSESGLTLQPLRLVRRGEAWVLEELAPPRPAPLD